MILITGATGKIGNAVIQQLLTKIPPSEIVALVRDIDKAKNLQEKGVKICLGDYGDKESLDRAMQGVEKVLLVSGGGSADGLQQHKNVVDAAKKAEVKCIAYTGRSLKNPETLVNQMMKRHFLTEDYIKESGLNYILFRNILYMDTLPLYLGEQFFDKGINLPGGDGRSSYALRSEMGEAIANVLIENNYDNRIYDFTGTETYSFKDVADALSELSGKEVRYSSVTPSEFESERKILGTPDFVISMIINFMTDIKNGQESTISSDLEHKLGRKPSSLKEGLKILFNL